MRDNHGGFWVRQNQRVTKTAQRLQNKNLFIWLVVGWATPLKNMKVNWDD